MSQTGRVDQGKRVSDFSRSFKKFFTQTHGEDGKEQASLWLRAKKIFPLFQHVTRSGSTST